MTANRFLRIALGSWKSRLLAASTVAAVAPLAVLVAAGPAKREKTFEFSSTLNPRVSLVNMNGRVTVRGWDRAAVRATCTISSPRIEVDAEPMPGRGAAEKVHFVTHLLDPLVAGDEEITDYALDVPLGASVEIRNRQGSVEVEKIQGEAWVDSTAGSVAIRDVAGHLAVKTLGGDIEIVRCAGTTELNSINGNLHIVSPASTKLRASTTSGKILYEGDFMEGGDYSLSTYSGDMDILCPSKASFELDAKAVKGRLENSFDDFVRKRHPAPMPGASANSLSGMRSTGSPTLVLRSFSGTIRIRPQ